VNDVKRDTAIGKLKGFKINWNPFNKDAYMQVDVEGTIFNVPIDRRQIRFILKEYQVGENMVIRYNGTWHYTSRTLEMNEPIIVDEERSVYI
jgi:hypothetical protein